MDLQTAEQFVSRVIDQMGGDAEEQQMSENAWLLNHGSAVGYIVLLHDDREPDAVHVLVRFRILRAPQRGREAFYRRVLELNEKLLGGAAFAISDEDEVTLQAGRPARDLDEAELVDLIGRTAILADHYDDILLDEFGRELAPE
jgi:hypothetical protein